MAVVVIKIGGAAMRNLQSFADACNDIVNRFDQGSHVVVVHGGGPEIDIALERMQIPVKKVRGLRVTDGESIEVVQMVLSGSVNKRIVSALNQKLKSGHRAVGVSARDGRIVTARKRVAEDIDLGAVGEVYQTDTELITSLLGGGWLPVVSSVAEDELGSPLNLNADEIASAIAVDLRAYSLRLISDVVGVLLDPDDPSTVVKKISVAQGLEMIDKGIIVGGMIPKIQSALKVVSAGVQEVLIGGSRIIP